jgi:chromosome segregation ATPase
MEQLRSQLNDFETTRQQLESTSKELATVSNQRDELQHAESELEQTVSDLQNEVRSQTTKAGELNELLTARALEYNRATAELQEQVDSQTAALEDLRGQLDAKTQQHDKALHQVASITKTLEYQQSVAEELTAKLSEAEKIRTENESLQNRVADLMDHLKRLRAELEDSLDANAKAQDRIRDTENQLHEHTIKIRQLRRERSSIAEIDDEDSGDSGRRAA